MQTLTDTGGPNAPSEQSSVTSQADAYHSIVINEVNPDTYDDFAYGFDEFEVEEEFDISEVDGYECSVPKMFDPTYCSFHEFYDDKECELPEDEGIPSTFSNMFAELDDNSFEIHSDLAFDLNDVDGFLVSTPAFLEDPLEAEYALHKQDLDLQPGSPQIFSSIPKILLPTMVPETKIKNIDQKKTGATLKDLSQVARFVVEQAKFMVCNGEVYLFDGPCWRCLSQHDFTIYLRKFLHSYDFIDSFSIRSYRHIFSLIQTDPSIQVDSIPDPPPHTLNLLDGTLDLCSMEFRPHRAGDCFFDVLDLFYEDICYPSGGDTFERFAAHIGNGDPKVRQQLLELVSLVITGTQVKCFYLLLGESHTGKTQFGVFLQELIGRQNTCALAGVHDFENRFATSSMDGKKLVTALDLPNQPLPQVAIGILKQCCGDDPLKTERKYKDSKTIYKKPLIVFASNHPLKIPEVSHETALLNRLVTILFQNPVDTEAQKQQLFKDFLKEKDYIVAEAIKAYRKLMAANFQPTKTELPEELMPQEGREKISAVQHFIFTQCEQSPQYEVSTASLYQAYDSWCCENGCPHLSSTDFSRLISEILRNVNEVTEANWR